MFSALGFALRRCFQSLEAMLGKYYICFSVFEVFEKFEDSELMSTNPAARKTENNLKCSTSCFVSNEVSLRNENSHLMVQLS